MRLILLTLALFVGVATAADVPKPETAPKPSVKAAGFDPPAVLESKGGFAIYSPPAEVKAVEYIALDGEESFPVSLVGGSSTAFVFFTRGLPAKNYRFVGVASDAGGNLTRKQFTVPVGNVPPVVTPPPKKDPITQPTSVYYFLIVRADGPATAAFTKTMQDPAWATLRKAGHTVGDMETSKVPSLGIPAPDTLPCVITLQESGMKSKVVRPAVDLPSTSQAILDLPKGVK